MYTGTTTLSKTDTDQLGWLVPAVIGIAAVGGLATTAWALIRGEDRRVQTVKFYQTQMDSLVQMAVAGPHPKFLEAVAGFDMSMSQALNVALNKYNKKLIWASPTVAKTNVLLFTSPDGNAVVIADKTRDLASIVASNNGSVDWDKVRAMIKAAADNNPASGWFKKTAPTAWLNQIFKLQTSGTRIDPISQVIPKVAQALTTIDVVLLVAGVGTIVILGRNLLKKRSAKVVPTAPVMVAEPKNSKMELVKV